MTFNPEQTTLKPTPICIYTLLYLQYSRATLEYISRGHHNAAMLWDFGLICYIKRMTKSKERLDAFYVCVPHLKMFRHPQREIHPAKVQQNFE